MLHLLVFVLIQSYRKHNQIFTQYQVKVAGLRLIKACKFHTYWATKVLNSSKLKLLQDAILTDHIYLNHDHLLVLYFLYPKPPYSYRVSTRFLNMADHWWIYEQAQIVKSNRLTISKDLLQFHNLKIMKMVLK